MVESSPPYITYFIPLYLVGAAIIVVTDPSVLRITGADIAI